MNMLTVVGAQRSLSSVCVALVSLAAVSGCTDAEAPPARASVSLGLGPDPDSTLSCAASTTPDGIPAGDSTVARLSQYSTPVESEAMERAKDGSQGADVTCRVVENAPGSYTIDADIDDGTNRFSVVGAVPGTGSIDWFSPKTLATYSSQTCALTLNETYEGGGGIRASYVCGSFGNPSTPNTSCGATGAFVLEECQK